MPKFLTGTVVSTAMEKTVTVLVERKIQHPLYKKTMRSSKKYKAQKGSMSLVIGDRVVIQETRPLSKDTHFKVIKKEAQ